MNTKLDNKKNILKLLNELSEKSNLYQTFSDVVICCAYAIANKVYYNQEREDSFLKIIKKYGDEGYDKIAKILSYLANEYSSENANDILGELFEELSLSSKSLGQFFTPQHVCDLMSSVTIKKDEVLNSIEKNGYFSVADEACGSGRLLYSSYNHLLNQKVNSDKILICGADIDLMCCCMSYIRLSLVGAAAFIKHQNTLSYEIYDVFYTPSLATNIELLDEIINDLTKDSKMQSLDKEIEIDI